MDPEQALKQAAEIAREAARLGVADQATLRALYQEYDSFVRQGVGASFAQLLRSRGLVDPATAQQLEAVGQGPVPGLERLASRSSGVVSLGAPLGERTSSYPVVLDTPAPPAGLAPVKQTAPFPVVLGQEAAGEAPVERTMEFDRVLPSQLLPPSAAPGATMEFDRVLPAQPDELLLPDEDFDPLALARPAGLTPGRSTTPGSAPSLGETFDTFQPEGIATTTSGGSGGSGGSAPSAGEDFAGAPPADFFMSGETEPEEEAKPPEVGDIVSGHEITDTIGRGGMGVIFKARRQADGRELALKVLLGAQGPGADRRRQRFRREVEAMRRLEHECIVQVFDYGRQGPFDWYTMELVQGRDFEKMLERGSLEPAEKMRVFEDICAAMAHAHERSVIHRDLKPQNVLVDARTNRGKVLDFGLAKILDQGVGMTRTGSALGTPYYMAPEQLKSAKHIDARADVFSLGVILYEITTGVRPFLGETAAEVGNRILTTEPPRPTKLKPDLHPDIDAMVVRALEKDPARRYADAGEFYADLINHRKGFGVQGASGLSGALGDLRRFVERNRVVVAAVGATALVFTVVIALVVATLGKGEQPRTKRSPSPGASASPAPSESPEPGDQPTPSASARPTPTPSPAAKRPSPSPSPRRTPTPAPVATPEPSPEPGLEPTPEPSTPPTRTPVDLARVALQPAEESAESGTEALLAAVAAEQVPELIRRLEARVERPLATGDGERALAELRAIGTDAKLSLPQAFVSEVEHDVQTLAGLRTLVARSLSEDPKRLRRFQLYGSPERHEARSYEVGSDGLLAVELGRDQSLEVDPLELTLDDLRSIVISRARGTDNATAHYALAVLGLYRGLNETELDKDLTEALRTTPREQARAEPAVRRRRERTVWLGRERASAWRAYEDASAEAWREVERKRRSGKAHEQALERYLRDFGRSAAYLERREAWLDAMLEHRDLPELLGAKPRGAGGHELEWRLKKADELLDFEVEPLDSEGASPRPFRAEYKLNSLALENARVRLQLQDLISAEGLIGFETRASTPVRIDLSGMTQELDPDAGWKVLWQGREVKGISDARTRKLAGKERELEFDRADDDSTREFFFRHPQDKLEGPKAKFDRPPKQVWFGAEALGDLRVTRLKLEWRKDENPERCRALQRSLLAARLSRLEGEESARSFGIEYAHVLLAPRAGQRVGWLRSGSWELREQRWSGQGGSTLWASRPARYGVFRFRYAQGDGPGLLLHLAPTTQGRGKPTSWRLPALLDPDPERFREVTVSYDIPARIVTVVVDGIRLLTVTGKRDLPFELAHFGLELVGRTEARIEGLELSELARPEAAR